jgi:hypothetical protein
MARLETLAQRLAHPRAPLVAVAVAIALLAPAAATGLALDDFVHEVALDPSRHLPGMVGSATDVFTFVPADPAAREALLDRTYGPWWAAPNLLLAFFRPLSSLTHWLDHAAWPSHPALMHVQSLAWYAALALVAARLYRRLIGEAWVAGLAAAFYALDDAHALPAAWVANRNALLAATFAGLALLAHDRWRRDAWRPGAALGPAALALGLLSAEAAVGCWGYLLAHAAFLDRAAWRRRLLALAPYAAVTVAWRIAYRVLDRGARGSGFYIDPLAEPLAFARAAAARAPVLLSSQLGGPPSDIATFLPPAPFVALVASSFALLGLAGWVLAPALRRDPVARFWAAGTTLSVLPACATFPMDRLLLLPGLGGMGLVAMLVGQLAAAPRTMTRPARAVAVAWLVVHGVLAPLLLMPRALFAKAVGDVALRAVASAPADEALRGQTLVIVNTLDVITSGYVPIYAAAQGRPRPAHLRCLGIADSPVRATRVDPTTLVLRPERGFFGTPMDELVRARSIPFVRGDRVELPGFRVEVTDVTDDGRPAEVTFRFDVPLEDASLRWITWHRGTFVPFRPPAVGASASVEAARMSDLL